MNVLSLNPGSSSLKFALYAVNAEGEAPLLRGVLQGLGRSDASLSVRTPEGEEPPRTVGAESLGLAVRHAVEQARKYGEIEAVGCRVVHGGPDFYGPARIDAATRCAIRELSSLAPLHNGADIETIESASQLLPNAPVYAVFDTAFHRTLPPVARTYALPGALAERHRLQRYGFHGISYRYASECLRPLMDPKRIRLVICHLGNGASVCALQDGKSVDTSMGLTPLEGLVMGTRSGDLDPGLVLYLLAEAGLSPREVDEALNKQSGLLGISGSSSDVRDLEKAAVQGDGRAKLALEVFAYRVAKYVGAYAAALEGLDALAFTGGIGEHSSGMRRRICRRLGFLGVELSEAANCADSADDPRRIDAGGVPVWIVRADEERQIACEVRNTIATM